MMEPGADNVTMYAPLPEDKYGYTVVVGRLDGDRLMTGSLDAVEFGMRIGRDVFRDLDECLAASEQLRLARIESLRKSLEKVESVGPHAKEMR